MNEVTTEQKDGLTKTFAIVGFLVLIIFGVWLAVKIVSFVPSAFSSLASLADSVYNHNTTEEIAVKSGNDIYNAGESFTLSWGKMRRAGTYTFSYACTDGVSLDIKNREGAIVALACGEPLQLDDATSLEVLIASEKSRFTDIPYTITYTKQGEGAIASSVTRNITVVNATIPTSPSVVATSPTKTQVGTNGEKTGEVKKPIVVTKPVVKQKTYVAGTPRTITKTVYSIPVSNPNGTIDLQVTYLGSGILSGSTFVTTTEIAIHQEGAIQFEVKNIGTKTTDSWNYVANLPGDITYTSGTEKALKPNERAIITLGFEGLTKKGVEKVNVVVTATNDVSTTNNKVKDEVIVVK